MREEVKQKAKKLGFIFKRFNQLVLVFPVWLVLGLSGLLRRGDNRQNGWMESRENTDWGKMH